MNTSILKEREASISDRRERGRRVIAADISCERESVSGAVSQRACVYCGARVVLNPITDAYHIVHGPIGCASYTSSEIETERGQLVDLLIDSHQYTYKKKVAIFGDPDVVIGLTSLALEMSMIPKYVISGTPKEAFADSVRALFEKYNVTDECTVKAGTDLFKLHQWIKNEPVDLLIGSSYGKQIARAEDIPFVRAGFPVIDRYGGTLLPIVGYAGGIRLAERIVNTLLDRFDRDVKDEDFELVL